MENKVFIIEAKKLLKDAVAQMLGIRGAYAKTQIGYVETTGVINRINMFLEDVTKTESTKKCIITNDKFTWILDVDGKKMYFTGTDAAEYFKDLYESLGYEVEFNEEPKE